MAMLFFHWTVSKSCSSPNSTIRLLTTKIVSCSCWIRSFVSIGSTVKLIESMKRKKGWHKKSHKPPLTKRDFQVSIVIKNLTRMIMMKNTVKMYLQKLILATTKTKRRISVKMYLQKLILATTKTKKRISIKNLKVKKSNPNHWRLKIPRKSPNKRKLRSQREWRTLSLKLTRKQLLRLIWTGSLTVLC